MKWVIARHMSSMDGTLLNMVEGSVEDVKEHLVKLVKDDREDEARNGDDSWDFGTESVDEVQVNEQGVESLYAFGSYNNFHIDYTAKPVNCLPLRKL